jgi:alpha/beta superfamily hydrolase
VTERQVSFELEGPAGALECLYQDAGGGGAAPAAALLCHPHPLYGGTMHNKVVYRMARALRRAGLPVLRFNFRGVGRSAGRYAEGRGEVEDARRALDWLAGRHRGVPLWSGGVSFGARVGLTIGASDPRVACLLAAGLPVRLESLPVLADLGRRPLLVVQGEYDEFGPPASVRAALVPAADAARLVVVPGAEHLFEGHLDALEAHVLAFAREMLGASGGSPAEG